MVIPYIKYHAESSKMRDIDPANDCLVYIANRFELNIEQRYWLAFLYSTCYCAPTAFYMYNEFPDFENVDVGRMERWWKSNKDKCVFQTDRLRIKTSNQFVPTFKSYRDWIGKGKSQEGRYYRFRTPYPNQNYGMAYEGAMSVRNIGRFTLFIYLEMVNLLTDFKCFPDTIDWDYADNCKKGLIFSLNEKTLLPYSGEGLNRRLSHELTKAQTKIKKLGISHNSIFNIETTLCAYAKYMKGQRYVGYYIDRQKKEIEKMKQNVTTGVCWRVMEEFRKETYKPHPNLTEPI